MKNRWLLLLLIVVAVAMFFAFGLDDYLSLQRLKSEQAALAVLIAQNALLASALYFAAHVLVAALSLPGAAVMTLAGGALFGLAFGTLLVSFASSLGATLAFLASRFLFRDAVKGRFGERLAPIKAGVARDGAFYLFTLRRVPAFPFFLVNLLMGLTPMQSGLFYLVSQVGMAMKHRLGLNHILGTVHAYPTLMEGNKYVAGAWRRAHAPAEAPAFAERYFAWRRT